MKSWIMEWLESLIAECTVPRERMPGAERRPAQDRGRRRTVMPGAVKRHGPRGR